MCFVYLFIVYFTVCRYKCEFLCDFYDPHFPPQLDFIKIETKCGTRKRCEKIQQKRLMYTL